MSQGTKGTALITGASSGIGFATTLHFATRGYKVIGTSRSVDKLAGLRDEALRRNVDVEFVEMDINAPNTIESKVPKLLSSHGNVTVLVNNAGYGLWGPFVSLSLDELRSQFETNFFAPARLMQAVLPSMIKEGHGTIVNVSSVLGRISIPFSGAYVASKHALEGVSESMRTELWPMGIRIVVVEPGYIQTDFHANQVLAEAAASPDSPYYPLVEKNKPQHNDYERIFANNAEKVARVVHKAVSAKKPAFRYPVGVDARLGMMASRVLPERLFHSLLSRATIR